MILNRVRRSAGLVRRAAREPARRGRLGWDLLAAWRPVPPPAGTAALGRLPDDTAVAAPRRELRAVVACEPTLAAALAFEWCQTPVSPSTWGEALRAAPDVVLLTTEALRLGWDAAAVRALVTAAGATGGVVLVWDTADVDCVAALAPCLTDVTSVWTVDPRRRDAWRAALPGAGVEVLPHGVQPRLYAPTGGDGSVRAAEVGLLVAGPTPPGEEVQPALKAAQALGLAVYGKKADVVAAYTRALTSRIAGRADERTLRAAYRSASAWLVPSVRPDDPLPAQVLQLAASRTPFVTGRNDAVAAAFGDLAPGSSAGDAAEEARSLYAYVRQPELRDRTGVLLQRAVLSAHTVGHRLDALLAGTRFATPRGARTVSAVVPTNRPGQLDHVLSFVGRQDHPAVQLVLVLHGIEEEASLAARAKDAGIDELVVVSAPAELTLGACMNLGVDAADGELIAKMDDDNLYGRAYLTDLVHAFDYTDAGVVGKLAHYVHLTASGAVLLRGAEHENRYVRLVQGGSMLMDGDLARQARFQDVPRAVDTTFLDKVGAQGVRVYSADRFNYVSVRRADPSSHTWPVSDLEIILTRDARLCFYGDPSAHVDV